MITLQVKRPVRLPVKKSILINAAQATLETANSSSKFDMSIIIGDDALLKKLNYQYRGENTTTDVLSFPSGDVDPDTSEIYLGDVFISLPRAELQATAEGHPLVDELQLLVVHGVLHLLDYDHLKPADKKKMQVIQDIVLKLLGLNLTNTL